MKRAIVCSILALAGACSDGGLVGGECRSGWCNLSPDGSSEVDASSDTGDAGAVDGSADAANDVHLEYDAGDAPSADGQSPDAGDALGADSESPDASDSACSPPLVSCAGSCVDLKSNPDHCGSCANSCPSGICENGVCQGATTGHIVLACMSFEANGQTSPQTTLLGNAVFLPPGPLVRILGYSEHAPNAIVNKVNQALTWAAAAKGRTYVLAQAADATVVPSELTKSTFDVFLVYDQTLAPAGVLGSIGSLWAGTIAAFVAAGGVVFVQSGGGGTGEMHALITSAGLLSASDQPVVTGTLLYNHAPLDAVGVNVLSPFLAQKRTCTFTTSDTPDPTTVFVISAAAPDAGPGSPVVVHRIP